MRILVWGTGKGAKNYLMNGNINHDEIVGCVENNPKILCLDEGIPVYSPNQIRELNFDKIVISSDIYFDDIKKQCMSQLNIPEAKFLTDGMP